MMLKPYLLGLVCLAATFQVSLSSRRPIWNLGHMVNAIKQVDSFLDDGANALESDVSFNKYGEAQYTYHGVPCDCFRDCLRWEHFTTFLEYVRDKSTPESPTPQLKFIMSLPHSDDIKLASILHEIFRSHGLEHLTKNIGWDVYSYEDLHNIRFKWTDVRGTIKNVWQGDGITNCLTRKTTRLQQAINFRNSLSDSFMSKVYYWTVDRKSTMRTVLQMGVDGIMTNHPARLRDTLNEGGFRNRFRIADSMDNPFEKFISYSTPYTSLENPIILQHVEDDEVQEVSEYFPPLPESQN